MGDIPRRENDKLIYKLIINRAIDIELFGLEEYTPAKR